jgi:hypothetical protein
MIHLSTEGFTTLSPEELRETEGGGLLTGLVAGLTPGLVQLLGTVYNVSNVTSALLKNLVNVIV